MWEPLTTDRTCAGFEDHEVVCAPQSCSRRVPLPKVSMCYSRRRQRLPRVAVVISLVTIILTVRLWYITPDQDETSWTEVNQAPADSLLLDQHINGRDSFQPISYFSRKLLTNSRNCTPAAIEQFPHGLFTGDQLRHGAIIIHILLAAYMFIALALVCDDYFVPACERLCELLKLSDDVAGATFMAAGSSAPELATACIGVFIAKDDIGLGAVVGSAVFNIMLVISICALGAGMVVQLKWWPLVRDCMYYTISILALVFVIYDEIVLWYEAVVLLVLYVLYIVLMYFNPTLEAKFTPIGDRWFCPPKKDDVEPIPLKTSDGFNSTNHRTFSDDEKTDDSEIDEENPESGSQTPVSEQLAEGTTDPVSYLEGDSTEHHTLLPPGESVQNGRTRTKRQDDCNVKVVQPQGGDQKDKPQDWVLRYPDVCWQRAIYVVSFPMILVMFLTIPDCRQPRWRRWYIFTFVMSIVWIGLFSYVMVWMITVAGHTFHIPDTVMGLTFIAAGSSVPDAIASLIVVREGLGDMAVSNAVGSNVFDILLCLGLPWLLQTTIITPNQGVTVYSAGLTYSALTLLSTVVFLLVATHVNRWRLTKPYGVVLLGVYILFNILASLYELNIFGYVRPPECPTSF